VSVRVSVLVLCLISCCFPVGFHTSHSQQLCHCTLTVSCFFSFFFIMFLSPSGIISLETSLLFIFVLWLYLCGYYNLLPSFFSDFGSHF